MKIMATNMDTRVGTSDGGRPVYFPQMSRQEHLHVLGRWNLGKSKLLERLIRADIVKSRGVCVIDPHGSLCNDLIAWGVSTNALKHRKIRIFQPGAEEWVYGFNPLGVGEVTPDERYSAVRGMVGAIARAWEQDIDETPRLARCLPAVLHPLVEKGLTILEAPDLCHPEKEDLIRRHILRGLQTRSVQQEWGWFNSINRAEFVNYFESTRNRIARFTESPAVSLMVGQTEASIDFSAVMDESEIVLVDLTKLDTKHQRLVGGLLLNDLYQRALRRGKVRSRKSPPFYLYVDEAHRFINDDIDRILFETRKFGLWMTLAHHNLGQLRRVNEAIAETVLQIPNRIVFGGLSPTDAREMSEVLFAGEFDLEEVKHTFDKPAVVGHKREWFEARGSSTSQATSMQHSAFGSESLTELVDQHGVWA